MRNIKKKRSNRILIFAAVLFYLVMVTTWISSGLYAKYVVKANGSDGATVAAWDVSATGGKAALNIDCSKTDGLNDSYTLTIKNDSEVAVTYDITVVLNEALPDKITMKLDNGSKSAVKSGDGCSYQFSEVGQLAAGNTSAAHSLVFEASSDYAGDEYATDVTVTVDVTQID